MQACQNQNMFLDDFPDVELPLGRLRSRLLRPHDTEDATHEEPTKSPRLKHFLDTDIIELSSDTAPSISEAKLKNLPYGWLVIVKGPGIGATFELFKQSTTIGRSRTQDVALPFGDTFIARAQHLTISREEDASGRTYVLKNKKHISFLNGAILKGKRELLNRDLLTVGETTLCFVSLGPKEEYWKGLVP